MADSTNCLEAMEADGSIQNEPTNETSGQCQKSPVEGMEASGLALEEKFLASIGLQPRDLVTTDVTKPAPKKDASALPIGWRRGITQRKTGATAGKYDAYIYSPDGRLHRSRTELKGYLEKKGITMDIDKFFIIDKSVYGGKSSDASEKKTSPKSKDGNTSKVTPQSSRVKSQSTKHNLNSSGKHVGINSLHKLKSSGIKNKKLHIRMNFKTKSKRDLSEDGSNVESKQNSMEISQSLDVSAISEAGDENMLSNRRLSNGEGDSEERRPTSVENDDSSKKRESGLDQQRLLGSKYVGANDDNTIRVRRNSQFLKRPSSMTLKRSKSDSSESACTKRKRRSSGDDVVVDGASHLGPLHLRESDSWNPPQSPFFLVEEQLYKDPWRILVSSLFTDEFAESMPRKAVLAFFKVCPTADKTSERKFKKIMRVLEHFKIDAVVVNKVIKFTEEYVKKNWTYPIELCGIEDHGNDAYRIFCINEWKQVAPRNPRLSKYHRWLWENYRVFGLK